MNNIKSERILEELEKGLGDGPLTLVIRCINCGSYFDLNNESLAMAIMSNTTFIDYLRWIQISDCPLCKIKYD